ncbi:bacterial regulatory s, gntR family protein, partial [Vibrio harveyi]|jgi:hypothetical protein
LSD